MLKLSTKGRYGTRFILDVAVHSREGPVTLRDASEREGISEKYLWQVVSRLKAAGLITATPGARGGYRLARETSDITLLDIVTALEGDLSLVSCVADEDRCERSCACVARSMWERVSRALSDSMREIRLADMVDQYRELSPPAADYCI